LPLKLHIEGGNCDVGLLQLESRTMSSQSFWATRPIMHQTTSSSLNTSAIFFGFDDRDTWRFVSIYRYFGPDFNCAYAASSSELTVYILTLLLDLATPFLPHFCATRYWRS